MNSLPFEKQFAHLIFCQQLQSLEIENAKQLLVDLHLIYLSQQATIAALVVGVGGSLPLGTAFVQKNRDTGNDLN